MSAIDLTRYIVGSSGTWLDPPHGGNERNLFHFTRSDTCAPGRLMLRWAGDFVALTGPLAVRVTVQAENMTIPLALVGNLRPDPAAFVTHEAATGTEKAYVGSAIALDESALARFGRGRALSLQASTIYSYTLDIPAGQAWPFSLSEQLDALRLQSHYGSRFEQLGNNLGYRVIIEPAFPIARLTPVVCSQDLPCDYAVADQPHSAQFFPSACEPCSGSVIGMPPTERIALVTPPAEGGCVRARFFNGMFITREDLETEQRYQRIKSRLHNRAAGAGVVWGYAVGKEGSYVCVMPGYGVDCCGNDLTLTTVYKVDIAALLADPAAAVHMSRRGPHRMHLLLEYVECPAEPRPVHGDPCAPEASRCEMSRIRESVRLRLISPRDYDAEKQSAPIYRFLNEARDLRARASTDTNIASNPTDRTPFQVNIIVNGDTANPIMVRPSSGTTAVTIPDNVKNTTVQSLLVEPVPDPLWSFVRGTVSATSVEDNQPAPNGVKLPDPAALTLAKGFGAARSQTTFTVSPTAAKGVITYKIAGFHTQTIFAAADDPGPDGELTLTANLANAKFADASLATSIQWAPLGLENQPCAGEPCSPSYLGGGECEGGRTYAGATAGRDPTPFLPFLHGDPVHPASAGDPKALVLAALGGWLAQMLVRERAGTSTALLTARREVAQLIYRYAWLLLFGVSGKAEPSALGGAIKRLLERWCDGLLWKGPQCCGEPHGVVIGCAVVEGGTIQAIDPFGGRRYVIHYPVLEHWGAQFGIAPPDIWISRFFSKLCCLGSLSGSGGDQTNLTGTFAPVGAGYIAAGDPVYINGELDRRTERLKVVGRRNVGLAEMIASALSLLGSSGSQVAQYEALVLADVVAEGTVMLLVPA
jgi:hypothetical protein